MQFTKNSPGHLAENVMHFARVLRTAGMPVGSDRVHTALAALQVAGLESKRDFHAVLSACLVDRIEHRELFDQAFVLFWRDPDLMGRMRALLLPKVHLKDGAQPPPPENRRLGDALFPHQPNRPPDAPEQDQVEVHAELTWNDREVLRQADFDTMTADEWREAQRLLRQLQLVFEPLPTRRTRRANRPGVADWRATLSAMARHGGELWDTRWRAPRIQPAPLLVLADISGSMSRYSRMLLHFAHVLGHADARVESFVFGTRLTRTTRLVYLESPVDPTTRIVDMRPARTLAQESSCPTYGWTAPKSSCPTTTEALCRPDCASSERWSGTARRSAATRSSIRAP
jgi:uncharacterized protein with von Willebrand factor type A (vWA) domain